jgi:hypothetical protein
LPPPRKNRRSLLCWRPYVIDDALIKDDHAAFAALLAKDLVVNNPQKGKALIDMDFIEGPITV